MPFALAAWVLVAWVVGCALGRVLGIDLPPVRECEAVARTLLLTPDDLSEATATLEALEAAEEALRDLRERCLRKDDAERAGRLRVAIFRVSEARKIAEAGFR